MKKFISLTLLIVLSITAYAQGFSTIPAQGKLLEYNVSVPAMNGATITVKQYVKSAADGKIVVNVETMGQSQDITYNYDGTTISISLKELLKPILSQIGPFFKVKDGEKILEYPASFKEDTVLEDGSISLEIEAQGIKLALDAKIHNRKSSAIEEIEVPNGKYESLKFEESTTITMSGQTQETKSTTWMAKGIGMVKQITETPNGAITTQLISISDYPSL